MIYLEASLQVVPGKMNEFMDVFQKEFLPASNKLGRKLVAQWRTTIGTLDEITDLWAYDDLSHMQLKEAKTKVSFIGIGAMGRHVGYRISPSRKVGWSCGACSVTIGLHN